MQAPESTPYRGTPAVLPGTIEAEHFDEGGAGIAYVDTTAGDSGGSLRATDVDIQPTSDAGAGYNVGWLKPGEWLVYRVDVTKAGSFSLSARVASNGPGGTFHVDAGGVNLTGPMTIPNTGGHQQWTTIVKSGVSLPAGRSACAWCSTRAGRPAPLAISITCAWNSARRQSRTARLTRPSHSTRSPSSSRAKPPVPCASARRLSRLVVQ